MPEEPYKGNSFRRGYMSAYVEIQRDVESVLAFLEGDTDREKIANFIKQYLIKDIKRMKPSDLFY